MFIILEILLKCNTFKYLNVNVWNALKYKQCFLAINIKRVSRRGENCVWEWEKGSWSHRGRWDSGWEPDVVTDSCFLMQGRRMWWHMQKTVALVLFSHLPIIPFNITYFLCTRREDLTCPTRLWMQYYSQTCATYTPTRIYPTGTKRNAIFHTIFMHTHTQHPSAQQWISVCNEKQSHHEQ